MLNKYGHTSYNTAYTLLGCGLALVIGAGKAKELARRYMEVEVVYGCKFAELFYGGMYLDRHQKITLFYHFLSVMPPFVL